MTRPRSQIVQPERTRHHHCVSHPGRLQFPADTNTPLGGGAIERTDTITNASTRSATYSAPSSGDWSVQVRAVNAVGAGLRKRAPATGNGVSVN